MLAATTGSYRKHVYRRLVSGSFAHRSSRVTARTFHRVRTAAEKPSTQYRTQIKKVLEAPELRDIPVPRLAEALRKLVRDTGKRSGRARSQSTPVHVGPAQSSAFSKYFQRVLQPEEISYEMLPPFISSSRDGVLIKQAKEEGCNIATSTSAFTSLLSHLYFTMARMRHINVGMFSPVFRTVPSHFTPSARAPGMVVLKNKGDGVWGMDSAPSLKPERHRILVELGKSMEKMVTTEPDVFVRTMIKGTGNESAFRDAEAAVSNDDLDMVRSELSEHDMEVNSHDVLPEAFAMLRGDVSSLYLDDDQLPERHTQSDEADGAGSLVAANEEDAASAGSSAEQLFREPALLRRIGNMLIRCQLDAQRGNYEVDGRQGVFDLKSRAVHPIRVDLENLETHKDYQVTSTTGMFNSFEREEYDLARSVFLKYSFQCRLGEMDGVLVTYHNTSSIFGYQFYSIALMDQYLYGSSRLGAEVEKVTLLSSEELMNKIIEDCGGPTVDMLKVSFQAMLATGEMEVFVETVDKGPFYTSLTSVPVRHHFDAISNLLQVDMLSSSQVVDLLAQLGQSTLGTNSVQRSRLEDTVRIRMNEELKEGETLLPYASYYTLKAEQNKLRRYRVRMDTKINERRVSLQEHQLNPDEKLHVSWQILEMTDEPSAMGSKYRSLQIRMLAPGDRSSQIRMEKEESRQKERREKSPRQRRRTKKKPQRQAE